MGAKNHAIVMPDSNKLDALQGIASGVFSSAG